MRVPEPSERRAAERLEISPYLAARFEYDRRFGAMANQIRFLRGTLLLMTCTAAFSLWGAIRLASQSRVVPYVVEVDRLGQVTAFGEVEPFRSPDRRLLVAEIRRLVAALRTVYTDPAAQLDLIDRGYFYTRGAARHFVDAYFSDPSRNPRLLSRDLVRQVDVTSILQIPGSESWKVEWRETEIPIRGGNPTISSWQANLRLSLIPPAEADEIVRNPLGIYVTDLIWTRVSDPMPIAVEKIQQAMGPAGGSTGAPGDRHAAEDR